MSKKNLSPKRIAIDVAGYACVIMSPLLGWLPGPGGIPLLLAGLGLLSIHNQWARNLLHFVRKNSESLRDIFFPDIRAVQWAWDILVVILIAVGTWLNIHAESTLLYLSSIVLLAGSTTIFLFNRHRLHWLERKLRRSSKD